MIVATHEGRVVGTKPCFALELQVGSTTKLGLQPADVMVDPDHRRNGLYSDDRATERPLPRPRAGAVFNFPNEATLSGSLKHGWRIVQEVPTFYRVQRPDALADGDGRLETLASLARPVAAGYCRARERLVATPSDVTVDRFDGIPVDQFVGLAGNGRRGRSTPPETRRSTSGGSILPTGPTRRISRAETTSRSRAWSSERESTIGRKRPV